MYVSGQINTTNPRAKLRSLDEIELICRRVLVAGAIPVAPAAWFVDMKRDPRLPKTAEWWVENIHRPFMEDCEVFCYSPILTGMQHRVFALEKDLWKEIHPSAPVVPAKTIMDFLLSEAANGLQRVC